MVPKRPCKPTLPVTYKGLTIKIEPTWFTSFTTDQKKLFWAALEEGSFTPDPSSSRKSGFLQVSTDITVKTTASIANVGHVYGRLGQGEATMPSFAGQTAWQWYDNSKFDKGMLLSLLPIDPSQTGLAVNEEIQIKAEVVKWADHKLWAVPEYPTIADDPYPENTSVMLGAGLLVSSALVAASLL